MPRKKGTLEKQLRLLDARVAGLSRAIVNSPFTSIFNSESQFELIYLRGIIHGIRWAAAEKVYEPAEFQLYPKRDGDKK